MTISFDRPVAGPASVAKAADDEPFKALALQWFHNQAIERPDEALLIVAHIVERAVERHVLGMRLLGQVLEEGLGVEKDVRLAMEWYRDAAEKGDSESLDALKRLACTDRVALRILKRLAFQKAPCAMAALRGLGVENPSLFEEVALFFRVLADRDCPDAMISLSRLYQQAGDPTQASLWFQKAAVVKGSQQHVIDRQWELMEREEAL